jgi:hypothetical protein
LNILTKRIIYIEYFKQMGNIYTYLFAINSPEMYSAQSLYDAIIAYSKPKLNLPHKCYPIPGITANFPASRGTISGTAFNLPPDCHIEVFTVADTLYPLQTRLKFSIDADGNWNTALGPYEAVGLEAANFPIGQSVSFNPPVLAVIRMNEDNENGTPQTLANTYKSTGLVRSYDTSEDDYLQFRTYAYDQALAVISACVMNDQVNAQNWALALVSIQKSDGQWPFHVNTISKYIDDAYYRTGTIMFCLYALGFYLKKFPNFDSANVIRSALDKGMHFMIDNYLVTASGDLRQFLFRGGKGRYHNDNFEPNYIISWCANEHNVDAYFALKLLDELGFSTPQYNYATIKQNLATALLSVMWNSETNMARQAIQNASTPSVNNALDNNTWYAIFAATHGDIEKAERSIENAELYYRYSGFIADINLPVSGFKMYSSLSDEPESFHVWSEGSAGAVAACRSLSQKIKNPIKKLKYVRKASNILLGYQNMADSGGRFGIRYTSKYEDIDEFCVAGTAWTLFAIMGRGFWDLV